MLFIGYISAENCQSIPVSFSRLLTVMNLRNINLQKVQRQREKQLFA